MFKKTIFFIVHSCLFSCAPDALETSSDPIIHGRLDHNAHPAVVGLLSRDGALCSGTLITPEVILTARHCVSRTVPLIDCSLSGAQVIDNLPASSISVVSSENALTGSVLARGSRIVVPSSTRLCDHDIAFIHLDRAIRDIVPMQVDWGARIGVGSEVTAVGFGRRGDSDRAGVGVRYQRPKVLILAASSTELVSAESTCNGDSGGPAIDPRTNLVVGVVSRGGPRCVGPQARVIWTRPSVGRSLFVRAQ